MLATGSDDKTTILWRVAKGKLQRVQEHMKWVRSVAFSPDGALLAIGFWEKIAQVYRVSDGSLLLTLTGHTNRVASVAFSPNGEMLATGSDDSTARLWRVADGEPVRTLTEKKPLNCVAFSSDGKVLATASYDTARLYTL